MFEHWQYVAFWLLWHYGQWVVGIFIMGLIIQQLNERKTRVSEEERLDRRRLQGGNEFNNILYDMRGDMERLKAQFMADMIAGETQDMRKLAAERVEFCDRNLSRIARMLNMKEPE